MGPDGVNFTPLELPESSHCADRHYCTLEEFKTYVNYIAAEFVVCVCVVGGLSVCVCVWVCECVCVCGCVSVCVGGLCVWVGGLCVCVSVYVCVWVA